MNKNMKKEAMNIEELEQVNGGSFFDIPEDAMSKLPMYNVVTHPVTMKIILGFLNGVV